MTTEQLKKRLIDNQELLTFSNEKDVFDIGTIGGKIRFQINGKSQPRKTNFDKFWTIKDIEEIIKENNLQLEEI